LTVCGPVSFSGRTLLHGVSKCRSKGQTWMLQALWCSQHLSNLVKHQLLKWNSCYFHTLVAMVALASQSFVSLQHSVLPCVWTLCILGYRIMSHSFFNHPVVVKQGVETVSGEGKPLRGTTLMNGRSQITMVNTRVTAGNFCAVGCLGDTANLPT